MKAQIENQKAARKPQSVAGLSISGEWDKRARLTLNQLLSDELFTQELVLQDVRLDRTKHRACDDYAGDLSGRFIESLSLLQLYTGERYPKLDEIAHKVIEEQHLDGHFGLVAPLATTNHGQIWGNGRLLLGLLTYARQLEAEQEKQIFYQVAERLGNYMVDTFAYWNAWWQHSENRHHKFGTDYASLIAPMLELYQMTGNLRYLDLAKNIAAITPRSGQGKYHMHGMLLAMRGFLDLYEITAEPEYLEATTNVWQDVYHNFMGASGLVPESFKAPRDIYSEGCGVADWFMLNLQLWKITGQPHYINLAERILYNGVFHTQRPSGHFGCVTFGVDPWLLTFEHYPEAWWCCTKHGARALHEAFSYSYCADDAANVWINFFVPSRTQITVSNTQVAVEQRTVYPQVGKVLLRIAPQVPLTFTLQLRLPDFTTFSAVKVNGQTVQPTYSRGYLLISRQWEAGDEVEFEFEMGIWVGDHNRQYFSYLLNCTDDGVFLGNRHLGFFYGPLLLAADGRYNNPEALVTANRLNVEVQNAQFTLAGEDEPTKSESLVFLVNKQGTQTGRRLVLTPIKDQTFYGSNTISRILFDRLDFEGV